MSLTYDVRLRKTRVHPRAGRRPYNVRWTAGGRAHDAYFATSALAESFKAELTQAARKGEAFDVESGLPLSKLREREQEAKSATWYQHATEYVDYKWTRLAATARVSVAETLVTITCALLPQSGSGRPEEKVVRNAVFRWAFNKRDRDTPRPADVEKALKWAEAESPPLTALADLKNVRNVLDACALRLDGKQAAANYLARRRQVFYNVLKYAVSEERLTANPLDDPKLNWERPSDMEVDHEVDPRSVGSTEQVMEMLAAVSYLGRHQGPRFLAFFGCLFYAMMRPEEAVGLRREHCVLPDEGWGRLILAKTKPAAGRAWTDSGDVHDDRGLKHRSRKATRLVPIPPELVRLLRGHVERYGVGPDGHLFRSVNNNPIHPSTYSRVWKRARALGMPPVAQPTPLLSTPYDLRHAGISVRLYAGVPPKQVAEWAGHSVEVLQRIYSKVLDGFDETWFTKIDRVLGQDSDLEGVS
ncbi:tyrosine-type recombinase/integrase [Actinoallomurus sp. CA-142502]|uniref:tyrosine-type recombinase/integrase n=1 Tax=Actinoallomurus sp. CA-142502 TaxID=3239885 RepID=UPI003D8D51F2